MNRLRKVIVYLCGCMVLAALFWAVQRTLEARQLESTVTAANQKNVTAGAVYALNVRRAVSSDSASPSVQGFEPVSGPSEPLSDVSIAEFRQWLAVHPEKVIPEMKLVSDEYWKIASASVRPGSDADFRQATRALRNRARQTFGERIADALASYALANGGSLPPSVIDLSPYFDEPVETAMLSRYVMTASGSYASMDPNRPIVGEISGVDDDMDSVLSISRSGLTKVIADRSGVEIQRSLHRYLNDHEGQVPGSTDALIPYLGFYISEPLISKYFINGDLSISGKK